MESKSFPSNFDIARRYAKHRKQHYLRYGEQSRTLVKFKVTQSTEFLESTAATIDDWNSSTKIFSGGEIQLFNKKAKSAVTIVSF